MQRKAATLHLLRLMSLYRHSSSTGQKLPGRHRRSSIVILYIQGHRETRFLRKLLQHECDNLLPIAKRADQLMGNHEGTPVRPLTSFIAVARLLAHAFQVMVAWQYRVAPLAHPVRHGTRTLRWIGRGPESFRKRTQRCALR